MKESIASAIQAMCLKQKKHYESRRNKKRYPATDDGRRRFIHDSLNRTLPRSVGISKSLKKDKTLSVLNSILEGMLTIASLPVILICFVWIGIKWLFRINYPISDEGMDIMRTRHYLHTCKHHRR